MLKAVYHNKYRSKGSGTIVLLYSVTGPKAEVQEYIVIQAAAANKTPDTWSLDEKGNPIYFLPLNNLLRQGRNPQASFNLTKSFDGTRYFEDTTAEDVKSWTRRNSLKDEKMAELQAKMELGIDVGQFATGGFGRPAAAPTIAQPAEQPATDDIAEQIAGGIGAATGEAQPAVVGDGVGTEEL